MFKTYYYEKPGTSYAEKVNGWVYLWAFLFGPLWFMWRGLWAWAAVAVLVNFGMMQGGFFPYLVGCLIMTVLSRSVLETSYGRAGWTRSEFVSQ